MLRTNEANVGEGVRILLDAYLDGGIEQLTNCAGIYGLMVWDNRTQTAYAIRDALGLQRLYVSNRVAGLELSDDPRVLRSGDDVDLDFVAHFIATGRPPMDRCSWRDVTPIRSGTVLRWDRNGTSNTTFWPPAIERRKTVDVPEAVATFKQLFVSAVRQDVEPNGATWADLSGGHDSTSVFCAGMFTDGSACGRSLGGSLTFVDTLGGGDESEYVDAVLRRFKSRNVRVVNALPWSSDGVPPPLTPQPSRDYPFYARDRYIASELRAAGATVLLSGAGPDYYLPRVATHALDMFWSARVQEAAAAVLTWAAFRRKSLWQVAKQELFWPLMPCSYQASQILHRYKPPKFLHPKFVREHGFVEHRFGAQIVTRWPGRIMDDKIIARLRNIGDGLHDWRVLPGIELRHPALNRSLVEFCLSLPYSLTTDAFNPKPVLRAAMNGIVPDVVLHRNRKGTLLSPSIALGMARERERLSRLLRNSVLAELGCIEPRLLEDTIASITSGGTTTDECAYYALSLDSWLTSAVGLEQWSNSLASAQSTESSGFDGKDLGLVSATDQGQ